MKIYIERFCFPTFHIHFSDKNETPEFLGALVLGPVSMDQAKPVFDLFCGAPQLLEAVDSAILHWKKKVDDKTPMTTEEIAVFGQLLAAARQCRVLRPKGENPK